MLIVAVHGIGQTFEGTETLGSEWVPALNSGLVEAGYERVDPQEIQVVAYGSLFRPPGKAGSIPQLGSISVTDPFEEELLTLWWREAARLAEEARAAPKPEGEDPTIQGPDFEGKARTPKSVQAGLRQLSKSRFFKGLGPQRVLVFGLGQVRRYLHEDGLKTKVLERVVAAVRPGRTRVVLGHSLGSIVAYEALCRHPEWEVDTLVTLGSPLGIRNLVFDQLTPEPGGWPNVRRWVNVADQGDIVALEKRLGPLFGERVDDRLIYNGWQSHSVARYLTAVETATAIGVGVVG